MHIILKSICISASDNQYDNDELRLEKLSINDFTKRNIFTIDTIKIRNPDKWKVAKVKDFIEEKTIKKHKTLQEDALRPSRASLNAAMRPSLNDVAEEKLLVINEDIYCTSYCPKVFRYLR